MAVAAVALLGAGCSKLSLLYVYNATAQTAWIVSDCGQDKDETVEALSGEWTKVGSCFHPQSWNIQIRDVEGELNLEAPTDQRGLSYLDDTFLRVEEDGLKRTRAPFWYVIKQPQFALTLFCGFVIAVGCLLLFFRNRHNKLRPTPGKSV